MATSRADAVFQPILDARTKAERLRSTLGVFERSKFFFNLPGVLGAAVAAVRSSFTRCTRRKLTLSIRCHQGKYDVASVAYKKGKYIFASRPALLLGLNANSKYLNGMTKQQLELQQKRIFDKVSHLLYMTWVYADC